MPGRVAKAPTRLEVSDVRAELSSTIRSAQEWCDDDGETHALEHCARELAAALSELPNGSGPGNERHGSLGPGVLTEHGASAPNQESGGPGVPPGAAPLTPATREGDEQQTTEGATQTGDYRARSAEGAGRAPRSSADLPVEPRPSNPELAATQSPVLLCPCCGAETEPGDEDGDTVVCTRSVDCTGTGTDCRNCGCGWYGDPSEAKPAEPPREAGGR